MIDPAIDVTRPLELKEWLERMCIPEKLKVAICNSGTYFPGDVCSKVTDGIETRAENAQQHYLNEEWKLMKRLGRVNELKHTTTRLF